MKKLFIILFLFIPLILSATDYYVKNGGNDASSGLDDANAWSHHPWMSTWTAAPKSLSAGDNVYMKCGGTWTISASSHYMTVGQSGSAGNYITTTSYSTGNKPILNISNSNSYAVIYGTGKSYIKFDNLEITQYSSTYGNGDGIRTSDVGGVPHDWIITNCTFHNIPFAAMWFGNNSYNMTIGDINATNTATATAYSNHIYDYGYAGVMLLGGNIATDRSDFKVYYNYIHDNTRTGYPADTYGIQASVSTSTGMYPHYVWMNYNRVEDHPNHEALGCHGASYLYIQDNYVKNSEDGISVFAHDYGSIVGILDHVWIERNIFEEPGNAVYPANMVRIYSNPPWDYNLPEYIYIKDNIFFFTSRPTSAKHAGIRIDGVNHMEISGNIFYNGPTVSATSAPAIYFYNNGSADYRDVTIKKNFIKEWTPTNIAGSGIKGVFSFENNIINPGNTPGAPLYINGALTTTADLRIYNNDLFSSSILNNCISLSSGAVSGSIINIKNNIIGRTSSNSFYYIYLGTMSGTFNCDYNLYYNSSNASPFYALEASRTWTYWTTTLLRDTHGLFNPNPDFINAGGSYLLDTDFELQGTSPAINAGVNVGLTTDYAGKTISGLPDIGALEVTALPTVTTTAVSAITTTTAISGGNVTDDGGVTVTARGVCWSISSNPTTANSHTTDGTGEGVFVSSLTALTPGTYYYVRAYAINAFGTSYGGTVNFTTSSSTPIVTTSAISSVTTITASGGGNVIAGGGATVTARGVCWDIVIDPDITDDKTTDGTGTGSFTSYITGLAPSTLYYVRAYATNINGTSYGLNVIFTTLATPSTEGEQYLVKDGKYLMKGSKYLYK